VPLVDVVVTGGDVPPAGNVMVPWALRSISPLASVIRASHGPVVTCLSRAIRPECLDGLAQFGKILSAHRQVDSMRSSPILIGFPGVCPAMRAVTL
jgi:hypothetical protein